MPDEGGGDDGPLMEVNWCGDATLTFIFLVEIVALLRHAQVNTTQNAHRQLKQHTYIFAFKPKRTPTAETTHAHLCL